MLRLGFETGTSQYERPEMAIGGSYIGINVIISRFYESVATSRVSGVKLHARKHSWPRVWVLFSWTYKLIAENKKSERKSDVKNSSAIHALRVQCDKCYIDRKTLESWVTGWVIVRMLRIHLYRHLKKQKTLVPPIWSTECDTETWCMCVMCISVVNAGNSVRMRWKYFYFHVKITRLLRKPRQ